MCVIGKSTPRNFLREMSVRRKHHWEAPELHKIVPASKPCETDLLCNWEVIPKQ